MEGSLAKATYNNDDCNKLNFIMNWIKICSKQAVSDVRSNNIATIDAFGSMRAQVIRTWYDVE